MLGRLFKDCLWIIHGFCIEYDTKGVVDAAELFENSQQMLLELGLQWN